LLRLPSQKKIRPIKNDMLLKDIQEADGPLDTNRGYDSPASSQYKGELNLA